MRVGPHSEGINAASRGYRRLAALIPSLVPSGKEKGSNFVCNGRSNFGHVSRRKKEGVSWRVSADLKCLHGWHPSRDKSPGQGPSARVPRARERA